jgi:large subunit ribosomal protein L32
MVVRMRATKGHRNNRRAHHKLENPTLSVCADCKAPKLSHTACPSCGKYKGKKVV